MTYNNFCFLKNTPGILKIIVLPRSVSERGAEDLREGGCRGQDLLHLSQGGTADKATG